MQNKTSLCIAHRINTIKDSDNIYVLEEGQIVENGNYQTLHNKDGFFARLESGESKKKD